MRKVFLRNVAVTILAAFSLVGCNGGASTSADGSAKAGNSTNKDNSAQVVDSFDVNQKITPYTRDTTSGTRDGFMTKIGIEAAKTDNSLLKSTVQQVTSNGDMIAKLSADEYGIGYFSFASGPDAAKVNVKMLNFEGVTPSEDAILDGSYKLSRPFNYCTATETYVKSQENGDVKWTIISAFVAFMGTQEGMADIVGADGLVSDLDKAPKWADIKGNYPGIEDNHSKITIKFGGSTSVEKVAKALTADFTKKAGNFTANHNHTGSGAAYTGTQGDDKGTLDIAFASRDFKTSEALAAGTYGKLCTDGIVVGVSTKNTLTNITAAQLVNIYSKDGTYSKWSDVK